MTYICRCGAHCELPEGQLELFSIRGNLMVFLCADCLDPAIDFITNYLDPGGSDDQQDNASVGSNRD